jgi:L-lactate dehydrogenase complex protein LldF
VCPVKIDIHQQLLAWRGELVQLRLLPKTKRWPMWWASQVFRRPWLYALLGKTARAALSWTPRFLVYNPLNGWGRQRELPTPPARSFRDQFKDRKARTPNG